jgi:hypothetical protein
MRLSIAICLRQELLEVPHAMPQKSLRTFGLCLLGHCGERPTLRHTAVGDDSLVAA